MSPNSSGRTVAAGERVFNAAAAAVYLGIHPKTLYKYTADGTIPRESYRRRPGNRYEFTESSLCALMDAWDERARAEEDAADLAPMDPPPITAPGVFRKRRRNSVYRD